MVHNFDPFLWQISGDFGIRWYGLSYMAGFICAYLIMDWFARNRRSLLNRQQVSDFVTYGAIGTLIGGRLGYCAFYDPSLFLKFKGDFPFWGVLAVNEGGMASHGGMIGLVVACAFFAIRFNVNQLHLYDLVAFVGPIGIFFGRIANFINGELVGRIAPADYKFAVKFPQDMYSWLSQSPEKISGLKDVVDKMGVTQDQWLELVQKMNMESAARSQVISKMDEIILSIQNGNLEIQNAIAPLLDPRYPSQLFGALGEGLFVFLVLFIFWRKPRRPGLVGALFLITYSIARIFDEQFRMPDAHIGYQWLDLTRGQWLSIAMLTVGLFLAFVWSRQGSLPIGGWARGENVKLKKY